MKKLILFLLISLYTIPAFAGMSMNGKAVNSVTLNGSQVTPKKWNGSVWKALLTYWDFFVGMGQSNALGHPGAFGVSGFDVDEKSITTSIEIKRNDTIVESVTDPGMGQEYYDGPTKIFADSDGSIYPAFTERWEQLTGRKCIIMLLSIGGSPLMAAAENGYGYWGGPGGLYQDYAKDDIDEALSALTIAGYSYTFRGTLFWDCERDAIGLELGQITQAGFETALDNFVNGFISDYGTSHPQAKVHIIQIGSYHEPYSGYIQAKQELIATTNSGATWAYDNNYVRPTNQHYYLSEYYEIGADIAENIYDYYY